MTQQRQPPAPLKQTPHIVAFLDFLGATEKMKSPEQSDIFLQKVYSIYSLANSIVKKTEKDQKKKLKVKIFSDNIVLAQEIENIEDSENIFGTYQDIEQFSLMLCCAGMITGNFIRGGISIGQLYIDDTFVFGQALLNAYNSESTIANYPRIIVDKEIFVHSNTDIWDSFCQPDDMGIVKRDIDGVLFLNPFWGIQKISEENRDKAKKMLKCIANHILKEYRELFAQNNKKVMPKYHWLSNQFNLYSYENKFDLLLNLDKIVVGGSHE